MYNETVYELDYFDDNIQPIILQLTNDLNVLSSNYPDICLEHISVNIANLLNKFDLLRSNHDLQHNNLNSSRQEVDTLLSKLFNEKEYRRKERESSLLSVDLLETENRSLAVKLEALQKALKSQDFQFNEIVLENCALKKKHKKLHDTNITLLDRVAELTRKLDIVKHENMSLNAKSFDKNRWVDDDLIAMYFNAMSQGLHEGKCLFFPPSVTHELKLGTKECVNDTLLGTVFYSHNLVFFCINNSDDVNNVDTGSHWSLLVLDNKRHEAYHFDSLAGFNNSACIKLLINIGLDKIPIVELDCFQQKNSFECGFNVIINAKYVVNNYCNHEIDLPLGEWYTASFKSSLPSKHVADATDCSFSVLELNGKQKHTDLALSMPEVNSCASNFGSKDGNGSVVSPIQLVKKNEDCWKIVKGNKKCSQSRSACVKNQVTFANVNSFALLSEGDNVQPMFEDVENVPIGIKTKRKIHMQSHKSLYKSPKSVTTLATKHVESKKTCHSIVCNKSITKRVDIVKCRTKLKILADSHGRGLSNLLCYKYGDICDVLVDFKPNGTLGTVIKDHVSLVSDMGKNDYLVVFAGTNDIVNGHCKSDIIDKVATLLSNTKHTNVKIVAIPYRYDKPSLNGEINVVNSNLKELVSGFAHGRLLYLDNLTYYKHYTRFGLHFNLSGKKRILSIIGQSIFPSSVLSSNPCSIPVLVSDRVNNNNQVVSFPFRSAALKCIPLHNNIVTGSEHFLEHVMTPLKLP